MYHVHGLEKSRFDFFIFHNVCIKVRNVFLITFLLVYSQNFVYNFIQTKKVKLANHETGKLANCFQRFTIASQKENDVFRGVHNVKRACPFKKQFMQALLIV